MQITTWIADVRELDSQAVFEESLLELPAWKAEKIRRAGQAGKRLLSLGAWLLLTRGLKRLGLPMPPIEIEGNGRPYFADRQDMDFSLSHSGNLAACSVAFRDGRGEEAARVGVDVERYRERDYLSVAGRFFSSSEFEALASAEGPEAVQELFYRYWTLKESCLKASGEGLLGGLDALALSPLNGGFFTEGKTSGRSWYFKEYRFLEDAPYALSVCGGTGGFADTVSRISLA